MILVHSMPACAKFHEVIQSFSDVSYVTSEQRNDLFKTRQDKDANDTIDIITFHQERDQFI